MGYLANRVAAKVAARLARRAAGIAWQAVKAFREGLGPPVDDATVVREWEDPRAPEARESVRGR